MAVTGIDGRLYKDQASADKAAARLANAPDLSGTSKTTPTPTTQTTPTTPKTTTTTTTSGNGWGESNYKDSDGYYSGTERNAATGGAEFGTSPTNTTTTSTPDTSAQDAGSKVRDAWNSFSYEKQQELLKNNPALQKGLAKYGAVNKLPEENVTTEEEEPVKSGTTKGNWDYQDNSPERMSEIADNVNKFAVTDPQLFANEDTFRNFFIDGKGRTPEQEKFLMDFYKNRKMYNTLDNYTAEQIGDKYVNGEIPESYLTYLKNTDPERYAYVMDAKTKAEDDIKDQTNYDTISSISGDGEDLMTSKVIQWLKDNGLLVDEDGNLVDDRRENYASEEENKYLKEIANLNARNLEIDNVVKHTYEDYVKKYPGATKATLMALAQDTNADLLREKENNMVELTKFQGYVNYMQSERQEMNKAGADTIAQLQKDYGMYYQYSPEGMSEYAQMQYAATNVTLDQADTGTYTQKQMALESVLSPIYQQYGSIIQRPMAQVINDVIAYAQKNGVSLSQALEENFMKQLKAKPAYKSMSTYTYTPNVFKIGENSYGYWDEDGKLVKIGDITGTGVGTMRTERNNNPTAMITEYAKQLGGIEGVDYEIGDSFTSTDKNGVTHTYYTAKLIGDPIDKTIELIDRGVDNNAKKNVFSAWNYADQLGMTNEKWKNMSREEKEALILKMLQHEGGDITKMAYYNETPTTGGYNDNLVEIYKMWRDKPDTSSAQKDFWNIYGDEIEKAGVSRSDFLKQYDAWYEEETSEAYLDILSHLDQLIELTGDEFDLGERSAAILGAGDVGAAYDYIKNNLTVQGLTEAKQQGLKLGVLSDSDVRMIAKASTTLGPLQGGGSWKKELYDFRQKLLNKNKYLKQKYENKSAYSDDVSITYDSKNRKFTIGATETVETQPKDIKNMGK